MTDFALSYKERSVLEQLTRCSTNGAKEYRRTQALLWLDKGESVQEIAERLRVSRQSIYNWAMRFQEREELDIVARLIDGERRGRPRTVRGIIDPLIDEVIEGDPRDLGYRPSVWTAPLLQRYLEEIHQITVCTESVRLALDRLRIRWKIENENNNTLKTKGYHFEHNYGHGQRHLSSRLATLILLAYLLHNLLEWMDDKFCLLRQKLPSRKRLFNDIRALTTYLCFDSWEALLDFMLRGWSASPPPKSNTS